MLSAWLLWLAAARQLTSCQGFRDLQELPELPEPPGAAATSGSPEATGTSGTPGTSRKHRAFPESTGRALGPGGATAGALPVQKAAYRPRRILVCMAGNCQNPQKLPEPPGAAGTSENYRFNLWKLPEPPGTSGTRQNFRNLRNRRSCLTTTTTAP